MLAKQSPRAHTDGGKHFCIHVIDNMSVRVNEVCYICGGEGVAWHLLLLYFIINEECSFVSPMYGAKSGTHEADQHDE